MPKRSPDPEDSPAPEAEEQGSDFDDESIPGEEEDDAEEDSSDEQEDDNEKVGSLLFPESTMTADAGCRRSSSTLKPFRHTILTSRESRSCCTSSS